MIAIFVVVAAVTFMWWLKGIYSYWEKKGIPGPKPLWILGNLGPNVIRQKQVGDIYTDIYRKYVGHTCVGIYKMLTPCLLVRDVEFLKNVTSKDFASFHDTGINVDLNVDPTQGGNPFVLKGEDWKEKRRYINNALTASKVKAMSDGLFKSVRHMMEYLNEEVGCHTKTLEVLDLSWHYISETALTCGYGIEMNVFENRKSQLIELTKKLYLPKTLDKILGFLSTLLPKLSSVVKIRYTDDECSKQLLNLIRSAFEYRHSNGITNNDYLGTFAPLFAIYDEVSVLGLAASLYVDGQLSSRLAMGLFLYNLAENPEVQEKLRKEVRDYLAENNGNLTYEGIQEMVYLDACFQELLRRQSVSKFQVRVCTRTYAYTPSDEKSPSIVIEKGTPIVIPYYAIHTDPKYFQDPLVYNPERFLGQDNHIKNNFFPFGHGPRSCPGKVFATIQVKIAVAHLINKFKLAVNPAMKQPSRIDPWMIIAVPSTGYLIDFTRLED